MKKIVTSVSLDPELHREAKLVATQRGWALSKLVESAVRLYLKGKT